jgi:hypothetical protein
VLWENFTRRLPISEQFILFSGTGLGKKPEEPLTDKTGVKIVGTLGTKVHLKLPINYVTRQKKIYQHR